MTVKLYDTTLRDGTQGEGISLALEDKLKIAQALDRLGVHYIEGGWPGSNPKDELFFKQVKDLKLKFSTVVPFGATRHKDRAAHADLNLRALVRVKSKAVCIFGKSWDFHVTHAIKTTLENNLKMISESVKFLRSHGREVIYDAEHFFDGFLANREYALATLKAAANSGAANLTLCDTNGGTLPFDVGEIVRAVKRSLQTPLGIHTHNDADCAVANSVMAVREGVTLVQGTINGYGERCGNANLVSVMANLKLKLGIDCISSEKLKTLTETARYVSEVANMVPNDHQPYVGFSAFAHKGGVHVSAVSQQSRTYEHIDPAVIGNQRRILISELSGKSNVLVKAKELKIDFRKDTKALQKVLATVKQMENQGYQYEGAEASFALLVRKVLGRHKTFFDLKGYRVNVEKEKDNGRVVSEATVKLSVNSDAVHTVSEGHGPVEALDNALRRGLERFYPCLKEMSLVDFKVRVINAQAGTGARVRVLLESRDAKDEWNTIGVSSNIIEASWRALVDSIEYKLLKEGH